MKEIMAFLRVNMVNATKEALAKAGYPAFTCRKCLGRGKKGITQNMLNLILENGELPASPVGEHLTEAGRLIAKRFFMLIVEDEQVEDVVRVIIETNQTGNPGDGRVFVLPISAAYTIRTFEPTTEAF